MKSFIVFGLGRFGKSISTSLYKLGHEVLAIDEDEESVNAISAHVSHAMIGDCTDESVLKSIGVRNFDVAIVAIGGDIQASIMVTLQLKEMGMDYIVAKAQSNIHAKVLNMVGAHRVVFPEQDMGVRVAHSLSKINMLDQIELSPDYSIIEITAPAKWAGKTLNEIDPRKRFGINVVAVKTNDDLKITPAPTDVINEHDVLVLIGKTKDLNDIQ